MDHDELSRLSRLARAGDIEARNAIVEANLGLVGLVVGQLRCRNLRASRMSADDLYQEGCIGLILAAEKWDEGRGAPFAAYARYWIEHFAGYAARRSALVSPSEGAHRLAVRWLRMWKDEHKGEHEIIRELGLCDRDVERVKAAVQVEVAAYHGGGEGWYGDMSVPPAGHPSEDEDWLHNVLSKLDAPDREALVLRYGIGGTGPLRGRELGRRLGVSRQAASDAVKRARERLAAALAG
jgi:RNA polymerase sigma factor (sigma-70 family)